MTKLIDVSGLIIGGGEIIQPTEHTDIIPLTSAPLTTIHTPTGANINLSPVFDVRGLGWESFTTPVPNNVTSALEAARLNWSVLPRPVIVDGEIVPGRIANVRSDLPPGSNVLEIVGSKYKIVQNRDAFSFVQDIISNDVVNLTRAGTFNNGKTVFVQGETKGLKANGEDIQPYVIFSNSHDGTSAVQVALTTVRVVCKNTLALALATAPRVWSIMHTKSAEARMKAARESMNFIGTYLTELPRQITSMSESTITDDDFEIVAAKLFPIPKRTDSNLTKITNATIAQAKFRMIYYNTPDLKKHIGTSWGVYNAYSDYVSHIQPIRESARFEENRFATNLRGMNMTRAQTIIEEMATMPSAA